VLWDYFGKSWMLAAGLIYAHMLEGKSKLKILLYILVLSDLAAARV
jgi:hypothetical protein